MSAYCLPIVDACFGTLSNPMVATRFCLFVCFLAAFGSTLFPCFKIFSRFWVCLCSFRTLVVVPGISLGYFPVAFVGVSGMLAIVISGPPGLSLISSCQPITLLPSLTYASPSAAISLLFVFCSQSTMPLLLSRYHVLFLQLSSLRGFFLWLSP